MINSVFPVLQSTAQMRNRSFTVLFWLDSFHSISPLLIKLFSDSIHHNFCDDYLSIPFLPYNAFLKEVFQYEGSISLPINGFAFPPIICCNITSFPSFPESFRPWLTVLQIYVKSLTQLQEFMLAHPHCCIWLSKFWEVHSGNLSWTKNALYLNNNTAITVI